MDPVIASGFVVIAVARFAGQVLAVLAGLVIWDWWVRRRRTRNP